MRKSLYRCIVLSALAASMAAPVAYAIPIGPGAFGGGSVVTTFDGLGLPTFSNPTPLVVGGNTFTTDDGIFRYSVFGGISDCVANECIGNDTDTGFIDVVLGAPAFRVGGWVSGASPQNWSIRTDFYNLANVLLGSVNLLNVPTPAFAGWEDAGGIGRVRFTDLIQNNRIELLDNFTTESRNVPVPEPTILLLMGMGLAGLGFARRRRQKA